MFKDRQDYIRQTFAPETAAQRSIRESLQDANDQIGITPEDGKLLQLLIRLGSIKKIVEIGTLGGYSAQSMAAALPQDGEIISIEKDARRFALAQKNLQDRRIRLVHGDALEKLAGIEAEAPFDMIFIDADKLHYLHYLDWAETHIRKGGLIAADNTFLFDAVWKDEPVERVRDTAREALRAFNLRLSDPEKYTGILLPTAEGMTIAVKLF